MRIGGRLSDIEIASQFELAREVLARFEEVPIQSQILQRAASAFPTVLGTLDAIHLATALVWVETKNETLTFLTHDVELGIAARACGLEVKMTP